MSSLLVSCWAFCKRVLRKQKRVSAADLSLNGSVWNHAHPLPVAVHKKGDKQHRLEKFMIRVVRFVEARILSKFPRRLLTGDLVKLPSTKGSR